MFRAEEREDFWREGAGGRRVDVVILVDMKRDIAVSGGVRDGGFGALDLEAWEGDFGRGSVSIMRAWDMASLLIRDFTALR